MVKKTYETGAKILYEPEDRARIVADIWFIHGLNGDRLKTWTRQTSKGDVCWPKDLLPHDPQHQELSDVRIITWGYNSKAASWTKETSQDTVFGHSQSLLVDLCRLRAREEEKRRSIVFIVHSLGGILIKEALVLSNSRSGRSTEKREDEWSTIFPYTLGVVFLGTPHAGSDMTESLELAVRLSMGSRNKRLLSNLSRESGDLERQSENFATISKQKDLEIVCAYETLPVKLPVSAFLPHCMRPRPIRKLIVNKMSAILHGCDTSFGINADHSNMCKFSDLADEGYQKVSHQVWQMVLHGRREEEALNAREKNELLKSLSFANMDDVRNNIRDHSEGTFEWLFDKAPSKDYSTSFVKWLHSSESIFWITGKPASGKSTLMNFIYKHESLEKHLTDWVDGGSLVKAIVFIRRSAESHLLRRGTGILRSLLSQMLSEEPKLVKVVNLVCKQNYPHSDFSKLSSWSWNHLLCAFQGCLQQKPPHAKLFLLIDGLDEFEALKDIDGPYFQKSRREKDYELERFLCQLLQVDGRPDVKICLASRPIRAVELKLDRFSSLRIHDHTKDDIKICADTMLSEYGGLWAKFETDTTNPREIISNKIQAKAQGVFMWVFVVARNVGVELIYCRDFRQLEEEVENSPEELCGPTGLYQEALENRVPENHREQGLRMLYHTLDLMLVPGEEEVALWGEGFRIRVYPSLLALMIAEEVRWSESYRNLSVRELFPVLASEEKCQALSKTGEFWLNNHTACLLELQGSEESDRTVVFAHETVREFLEEQRETYLSGKSKSKPQKSLARSESYTRAVVALIICEFRNLFLKNPAMPQGTPRRYLPGGSLFDAQSVNKVLKTAEFHNQILSILFDFAILIDQKRTSLPDDDSFASAEEKLLRILFTREAGRDFLRSQMRTRCYTVYRSQPYLDFYLGEIPRQTQQRRRSSLEIENDKPKDGPTDTLLETMLYDQGADPNEKWDNETIWHRFLSCRVPVAKFASEAGPGRHFTQLVLAGADMRTKVHLTVQMKQYLMGGLKRNRTTYYRKEGDSPNVWRFCKKMDESLGRGIDHATPAYILAYFVVCCNLDLPEYIDDFKLPPAKGRLSLALEILSKKNRESDALIKSDCVKYWEMGHTKTKRKSAEIQLRRLVSLLHHRRVGPVTDLQEYEFAELTDYFKKFQIRTLKPEIAERLWREKKEK